MIRIKILLKMSQSLKKKKKKKEIRSQGPFPFFNNKMEHPRVKCSLLFLIVLVASKLPPKQNYSAARNLCDKSQTQHKINLILVTYQFKKNDKYSNWIYANTSQRPIFKEIGLILKKTRSGNG